MIKLQIKLIEIKLYIPEIINDSKEKILRKEG